MGDLLLGLFQANLAATAAILLVIILRRPVRRLIGADLAYALWLLVPVTTFVSFAPPRRTEVLPVSPVAPGPIAAAAEQSVAALWTLSDGPAVVSGLDPSLVAVTIWLTGMLLMFAWLFSRQSQFMRQLRQGKAGPAVIGVIRPRIVTPADFELRFDAREQAMVLAHEKIHLARHDTRINAVVAFARCICWCNPVIHLAAHLMRVDQELACDAAVVAQHPRARAPYAQALLKGQLLARSLPLGCYWPASAEHPLLIRLAMLKRARASLRRRVAGTVLLALLSITTGYAAWAAAPASSVIDHPLKLVEDALANAPSSAPEPDRPSRRAESVPEPKAQLAGGPEPVVMAEPALQYDPSEIDPEGRPRYGQPFARRYDGGAPVWINGVIVRVDYRKPNSVLWVYGGAFDKTGAQLRKQLWRVDGGQALSLSREQRAAGYGSVGKEVSVHGYSTKEKACEPTCRVNGMTVILNTGERLIPPVNAGAPDCTWEQVRTYVCPDSATPSPIPVPPTKAEIAAALTKGRRSPA